MGYDMSGRDTVGCSSLPGHLVIPFGTKSFHWEASLRGENLSGMIPSIMQVAKRSCLLSMVFSSQSNAKCKEEEIALQERQGISLEDQYWEFVLRKDVRRCLQGPQARAACQSPCDSQRLDGWSSGSWPKLQLPLHQAEAECHVSVLPPSGVDWMALKSSTGSGRFRFTGLLRKGMVGTRSRLILEIQLVVSLGPMDPVWIAAEALSGANSAEVEKG